MLFSLRPSSLGDCGSDECRASTTLALTSPLWQLLPFRLWMYSPTILRASFPDRRWFGLNPLRVFHADSCALWLVVFDRFSCTRYLKTAPPEASEPMLLSPNNLGSVGGKACSQARYS